MTHPPCLWCNEPILCRDLRHSLLPDFHYACALRQVIGSIGHIQGKCGCFVKDGPTEDDPPGLTRRQAAQLVADYARQQHNPQPGRN